jgi:hypothetical protein
MGPLARKGGCGFIEHRRSRQNSPHQSIILWSFDDHRF